MKKSLPGLETRAIGAGICGSFTPLFPSRVFQSLGLGIVASLLSLSLSGLTYEFYRLDILLVTTTFLKVPPAGWGFEYSP